MSTATIEAETEANDVGEVTNDAANPAGWRVGGGSHRPIVYRDQVTLTFMRNLDPNISERTPTFTKDIPELQPITHERLKEASDNLESVKLYHQAKALLEEQRKAQSMAADEIDRLNADMLKPGAIDQILKLKSEFEARRSIIDDCLALAQRNYDQAVIDIRRTVDATTSEVFQALLEQRKGILAELLQAMEPYLERLAMNGVAISRRSNAIAPTLGERP